MMLLIRIINKFQDHAVLTQPCLKGKKGDELGGHEDELDLIRRAQRNDDRAMAELLGHYYPFMLRYLIKMTYDPWIAEEVAQEAAIRCMTKIHHYRPQVKFSTWLFTIATRLYLDRLRKQKREAEAIGEATKIAMRRSVEQDNGTWEALLDHLAELPAIQRTMIVLRHYYGYTYAEIATMLELAEGTVKSKVHYALQKLKKEWRHE